MTDTKELRRLAQVATPGPWQFWHGWAATRIDSDDGTVIAERPIPSDGKYQARADGNFRFIAAANPSTVIELINRLEDAESDALEQARLNGMGSEREAALMAKLEAAEKERDAMRAKIEAMQNQEPYSYIYEYANPIDGSPVWRDTPGYWNAQFPRSSKPLYALPGAQPAQSVPDEIERDVLRACCGTFHGSRHRITCERYKGKKAPEAKP